LGNEPGSIEDQVLVPDLDEILPEPPLTESLKRERSNMKKSKDFADFFFWDWD
jgi:hypothetical protein